MPIRFRTKQRSASDDGKRPSDIYKYEWILADGKRGRVMSDRPYWCEICARKKECYGITLKPKCFVPITNTASGTPESYLAKSLRYSQDSHEIAKDEPQTERSGE